MPDITWQLHADRDACIGSGSCVSRDPDVFDQDDAGFVRLHSPTVTAGHADAVRRAVTTCPSAALKLTDLAD